MREAGLHHGANRTAARRRRPRIQPYPAAPTPGPDTRRTISGSSSGTSFGGDQPPDWQVHTTFAARRCRTPPNGGARTACSAWTDRSCRRRSSRWIRAPATFLPWSAARLRGRRLQSRVAQPAPAGLGVQAVRLCSGARARISPVSAHRRPSRRSAPQGTESGRRETRREQAVDALTLRAGSARVEQRRRRSAAASRSARVPCCGLPATRACGPARRAVARARVQGSSPRSISPPLTPSSRAAASRTAPRHRRRARRSRRDVAPDEPVERDAGHAQTVAFQMVSMLRDVVDRGTRTRSATLGHSGARRREDGYDQRVRDAWFVGFSSSVVVGVWVGFDQPATIGRERVRGAASRCRSGRISCGARHAS